jgi:hypothetical protein
MTLKLIKHIFLIFCLFFLFTNAFASDVVKQCLNLLQSKNFEDAVPNCTALAKEGNPPAQYFLATIYLGNGLPKNEKEVIYWYTKSAENGFAPAQYAVGSIYYDGSGLPKDHIKAVYWLTKSAEQGFVDAQYVLGNIHRIGVSVPQDDKQAFYWTNNAAKQGFVPAQYNLGIMYFRGRGVIKNYIEAYAWLNITASQRNEKARQGRDLIEKEMIPAQLEKAQKLSKEYFQKYVKKE